MTGTTESSEGKRKAARHSLLTPAIAPHLHTAVEPLSTLYRSLAPFDCEANHQTVLDWYRSLGKYSSRIIAGTEGPARIGKPWGAEIQGGRNGVVPLWAPSPRYRATYAVENALVRGSKRGLLSFDFDAVGSVAEADFNSSFGYEVLDCAGDASVLTGSSLRSPLLRCAKPSSVLTDAATSKRPESLRLPLGEPVTHADAALIALRLDELAADNSSDEARFDEVPEFALETPLTAQLADIEPLALLFMLDADAFFSKAKVIGTRLMPLGHDLTILSWYYRAEAIAAAAAASRTAFDKFRKTRVTAIKKNSKRLAAAVKAPKSLDGRIVAFKPSSLHDELECDSVLTSMAIVGDFRGFEKLKRGEIRLDSTGRKVKGWGSMSYIYLFLLCGGDLEKMWETLEDESVSILYPRGRIGFVSAALKQVTTHGLPADPRVVKDEQRNKPPSFASTPSVAMKHCASVAEPLPPFRRIFPCLTFSLQPLTTQPSSSTPTLESAASFRLKARLVNST